MGGAVDPTACMVGVVPENGILTGGFLGEANKKHLANVPREVLLYSCTFLRSPVLPGLFIKPGDIVNQ